MPDIAKEQVHLEKADADIRAGEARVAQQRLLIEELRRDGHDARDAERLLWTMQQSLKAWGAHREVIRQMLADAKERAGERPTGG